MGPPQLHWHHLRVLGRRAEVGLGGDGPTVVLLHGWALSGRTYRRAHERLLEQGYRVVAPSMPGFGGSASLTRTAPSFESYAAWVGAVLDELGIAGPTSVLGHSFGGGVAVQFATSHRERVQAVVLVNSVGGAVWRTGDPGGEAAHLADRPLWDWGLHVTREAGAVLPVAARDVLRNAIANPRSFVRVAGLARSADLRSQLEQLKEGGMPIVVLWGDEDRLLPQSSLEALAAAGGAAPTLIPGRHSWLITHPETFAEVITDVAGVLGDQEAAASVPSPESTGSTN